MQVTHANDHVTHAVIGGGASVNFGISDSPEFFQILSSTLYQDQKRAVIRETLCNAWDAHIASGRTNTPIKVKLDLQSMSIQDFGLGIHKSMIGPIYGVYGASTKKNDGKQTGGFGLGCKAPFAYTDHFQVTSSHEGERTIYNMSKSSGESLGKPSITAIASFPTTEAGITVAINILDRDDVSEFNRLIKEIAFAGEMLVEYNGTLLPMMKLSEAPHGFIITKEMFVQSSHTMYVRYGNVVYPIPNHAEYSTDYNRISRIVSNFGRDRWSDERARIVFMAPPNSIAVTPSRESLSMQPHTISTLTNLLSNFKLLENKDFIRESIKLIKGQVDYVIKEKLDHEILRDDILVPMRDTLATSKKVKFIQDMPTAALALIVKEYPEDPAVRHDDINYRLFKLKQSLHEPRGLVTRLLEAHNTITSFKTTVARPALMTWFGKNIARKLWRDCAESSFMDYERFRAYDNNVKSHSWHTAGKMFPLHELRHRHTEHYIPYLRNIVVIAPDTGELNRLNNINDYRKYDKFGGHLIYFIPKNAKELPEVRQFLIDHKYTVYDLTQPLPGEHDYGKVIVEIEEPPKVRVPRQKGLPSLTNALTAIGRVDFDLMENTKRIEAPDIVVKKSASNRSGAIGQFSSEVSHIIMKMYGDHVGVVGTTAQYDRYIEKGASSIESVVVRDTILHIDNSATIQASLAFNMDKLKNDDYFTGNILNLILRSDSLSAEYGIVDTKTDEDREYLRLFNYISRHPSKSSVEWNSKSHLSIALMAQKLDAIPAHPNLIALVDMITKSKALWYVDMNKMRAVLAKDSNSDPAEVQYALDLFKNALKN